MKKNRGFSLLEVMVAIAILAVASMTLLIIRNNSVKDAIDAIQIRRLKLILERKMGEIESGVERQREGTFQEPEFRDFVWITSESRITIQTKKGPSLETLRYITLTVYNKKSTKEKGFTVSAYFPIQQQAP